MKKEILITVIVPVYNAEKYLKKCIESIIKQQFTNYEILIINDGSTDKSLSICNELKNIYNCIRVINHANQGIGKTRNEGIDNANGKYIMFLDSDDYIEDENFFEKINGIIEKQKDPTIIIYGYKKMYEASGKFTEKNRFECKKNDEIINELIRQNYYKGCPWDKIVKKDFIKANKIVFPNGRLSEDIKWCGDILEYAKNSDIQVLNENPYVYVQRKRSITKSIDEKHINDIIWIFNELIKNTPSNVEKIEYSYIAYEYSMILGLINSKYKPKKLSRELKKKLFEYEWILKYDVSNKVKKVNRIRKIFGIKITSVLLGIFINLKEKKI